MQLLLPILHSATATWFPFVCHAVWQTSLLTVLLLAVVRLGRCWPAPLRYWLLVLALAEIVVDWGKRDPASLSHPTTSTSIRGERLLMDNGSLRFLVTISLCLIRERGGLV